MKRSLCCLLLTLIAACGKEPKTRPNQEIAQENFTLMSSEEILRVKYDNDINLVCELRIHEGPYIDLNYRPSRSFSWGLTRELAQGRSLEYEFKGRKYQVEINLASTLKIQNLDYVDAQGERYSMTYSPTIDVRYRSSMGLTQPRGIYDEKDFIGEARLFENVSTVIYSITSENLETGDTISEDLRCELRTKPKPQYQDQWLRR